jgi:hypothetical protein
MIERWTLNRMDSPKLNDQSIARRTQAGVYNTTYCPAFGKTHQHNTTYSFINTIDSKIIDFRKSRSSQHAVH